VIDPNVLRAIDRAQDEAPLAAIRRASRRLEVLGVSPRRAHRFTPTVLLSGLGPPNSAIELGG
jgi:hypothetical protein